MLDRASTFSDPAVVDLLKSKFIPVAIDQAYQRRQKDAEGHFYQKIANQGPRPTDQGTTQGRYVATADVLLLGFNNNRDPARLLKLMQEGVKVTPSTTAAPITPGPPDPKYVYGPPKGGLVVRVNSLVLGGYEETTDPSKKIFQEAMGRDNLWIRKDEHVALAKGEVPESLIIRLARFHLVDNTRGEPPMWEASEIMENKIELNSGKLSGNIHLKTPSGDREFKVALMGFVEVRGGVVTRFDLVAKGLFRGDGPYTGGAPKGDFPLAIAFRLADNLDPADGIPPQGSRGWLDGYLK